MSYTVNGKIYTEHSLMDEIVYNCKIILSEIVIKNETLANKYETQESVTNFEYYKMITENRISFSTCPITYESLKAFGYDPNEILKILNSRANVPEEDREALTQFTSDYFMENFEEMNDYYRSLMGLPPYNTTDYYVYISAEDFPADYDTSGIDFTLPIHLQPNIVISVLKGSGKYDEIIDSYGNAFNYSYLRRIGDGALDIYNIRKALIWEILYMPSCETLVKDKFKEFYIYNRKIYLNRYYQEAYEFNNQHYESMMIVNILAQTFADLIVDVPEWYVRRDIFDMRSIQYFLESYGVTFFKEIPLKYQTRIVKSVNKLIKYKSSNKNNFDILDVFGLPDAQIYKYYLFKRRLKDPNTGEYVVSDDIEKEYELQFIKTELEQSYDAHIADELFLYDYHEMVLDDKYWDGLEDHHTVYLNHLNRDFIVEPTKYMTLEYGVSVKDYMFQLEYFIGMITDSRIDMDYPDMKVMVPSIQQSTEFSIKDLIIFLIALTYSFDSMDTTIIRPEDVVEPKYLPKPEFKKYDMYDGGYSYTAESDYFPQLPVINDEFVYEDYDNIGYSPNGGLKNFAEPPITNTFLSVDGGCSVFYSEVIDREVYLDWMKKWDPEYFVYNEYTRIFGFNPEADMDYLAELIGRRHPEFGWQRGFTLEELGIDTFIVPTSISSVDQLQNIYFTNKDCYDTIVKKLVDDADDRDEYKVLRYVYDYLFTKTFDYNKYKNNQGEDITRYEYILENTNYVLYNLYKKLDSETNIETKQDNIRQIISDIVNTLEYYITADGLQYIFNFAATNTVQDLVKYISLLIGFFKSYKVSFLDPFVVYDADDKSPASNGDYAIDAINELEESCIKSDSVAMTDAIIIDEVVYLEDQVLSNITTEVIDIYAVFDPDPLDDYDYDGMYAATNIEYKDADGGYADDMSCVPYIMLNAGTAYGGRLDWWDLDGASAKEMMNYLIVDGGYSYHDDEYDGYGYENRYSYQINGGNALSNQFRTKTAAVRVVNRAISTDILISKYTYNSLKQTEDGIIITDDWTDWQDFKDLDNYTKEMFALFEGYCREITREIELVEQGAHIDRKIDEAIHTQLAPMYKILSYIYDFDLLETELKDYTDHSIYLLEQEFYAMNPIGSWGSI